MNHRRIRSNHAARSALALCVVWLGQFAHAQTPTEEAAPVPSPFAADSVSLDGVTYPFRLLVPPEDAPEPDDGWPLVVFLHGAGERGDDNLAQLGHFPTRMLGEEYRERFPCYVLAVQCPKGAQWAATPWRDDEETQPGEPSPTMLAAIAAIERVVTEKPIDLTRVYLTGLSLGGFGSWDLAARKPDWFAAVAPICGGGDPGVAEAYRDMKLWVWHDEGDRVVPASLSREMVKAAEQAGADVRYEETTGHGHASWVPAYDADNVPAWMFEQQRRAPSEELAQLRERE